MYRGYIKLWRCSLDDELLQLSPNAILIAIILLLKAQHIERKILWNGESINLRPGQLIITEDILMSLSKHISRQNVRTSLKNLEKVQFLTKKLTKNNKAGSLITIVHWEKYQDETNQETNQELTKSQPRANQELTTNKNVKNVKNVKKDKEYKPKQEARTKHGEYGHVLLTEKQYCKLVEDWGQERLDHMVVVMDEAIEEKGNKWGINNFNIALRKWEKKDFNKPSPQQEAKNAEEDKEYNDIVSQQKSTYGYDWSPEDGFKEKIEEIAIRNNVSIQEVMAYRKTIGPYTEDRPLPESEYKSEGNEDGHFIW